MIAILNLGPAPGNRRRGCKSQALSLLGPHLYQVKINHSPVAIFTHTRSEPLSALLAKASAAALEHEHNRKHHQQASLPSAS